MMDETKDTLAAEDDGLGGADANEPRERRETKLAHEDTDRDVLGHASWPTAWHSWGEYISHRESKLAGGCQMPLSQ